MRYFDKPLDAQAKVEELEFVLSELTSLPEQFYEISGVKLGLSKRRMLSLLVHHQNQIVSKHALLQAAIVGRGDSAENLKMVDVYICLIRKALRKAGVKGEIETAWGIGYRATGFDTLNLPKSPGAALIASRATVTHIDNFIRAANQTINRQPPAVRDALRRYIASHFEAANDHSA